MGKMVVLHGPGSIVVEEYAEPVAGPGEVRVRTLRSGISAGTQLTLYRGTSPFARKHFDATLRLFTPGEAPPAMYPIAGCDAYEEVGRVDAVGEGVAAPSVGDIVYGSWGHRSIAILTAAEAVHCVLPAGLDPACGAFSQIGSIALNAVLDADIHIGETVVIFGQGVPGQIVSQLARLSGARVVAVDPDEYRLEVAERLGAHLVYSPSRIDVARQIRGLTDGRGADLCIEISGSPAALQEAIRSVCYNGRVVCSGFFPGSSAGLFLGEEFHHNRVQLICSQIKRVSPSLAHRWSRQRLERTIMDLQRDGRLDLRSLVTHVVPAGEAARAYQLLDAGREPCLQVLLTFE